MGKVLYSGGGGGTDTSAVTANASDVLSPKVIVNANGDEVIGTMVDVTDTATITHTTDNPTKVRIGNGAYVVTNSDGVQRLEVRYSGAGCPSGYIQQNTLIAYPASEFGTAATNQVLKDCTFTSTAGLNQKGTIPSKAAATYNTSTSDRTISSGQYLSGAQTIKAVTTSNIDAGNIKKGVVVKVGDGNSDTRIKNVTGTYTTVSSGQTAVTASAMLPGYSGFANGGGEVKGSMPRPGDAAQTASNSNSTAGTYCYYRHTTNKFQVIPKYGYYGTWDWDKAINIPVTDVAGSTITPGTADKTAVAASRWTTGAVNVKGDANLAAGNILNGKSIFGVSGNVRKYGTKKAWWSSTTNRSGTIALSGTSGSASSVTASYYRVSSVGFTPVLVTASGWDSSYNGMFYYDGSVGQFTQSGNGYQKTGSLGTQFNSTYVDCLIMTSARSSINGGYYSIAGYY